MKSATCFFLAAGAFAAFLAAGAPAARAQDPAPPMERRVTRGMHDQIKLNRDVARVAVGDQKVLETQVLNSRSILLLGKETGRTSLLIWFADETMESFVVSVEPEYELLRTALLDIHESITVEIAPDRAAVVLRGVVPDVSYSRAAEAAASAYLRTGRPSAAPVVAVGGAAGQNGAPALVTPDKAQLETAVINLIRVDRLPQTSERRIQDAIASLGAPEVRVERLLRGESADDASDALLLKGRVRDQILLTRVLNVASTMFLDTASSAIEVTVAADEGGGLFDTTGNSRKTNSSSSSSSSISGAAADTAGASLGNELESNLARAKMLSIGKGRILSMIEVADVPQVRVAVRMYEVNRTKLLQYAPRITTIWSDFNQPSLSPSAGATGIQGGQAARVGPGEGQDVQGVLSFLENGLTQQGQYAGSHFAMDALFTILESRSIARALANPSLTVLSGENANFQVGGEIPIPENFSPAFGSDATAGDTTPGVFNSVRFRRFGVGLAVRPLVGDGGRVTIDILTNVDQPDATLTTLVRDSTGTDPQTTAFQTRRIETTTRLDDGQSLMLGGLISRRASDDASYAPGLERLPGLGWLFKSFNIKDEDTELVIIISPTIVRDPIADLAVWVHPDISGSLRHWVDRMIEHRRVAPPADK